MAWCFNTRAPVMRTHPCVSSCLWVDMVWGEHTTNCSSAIKVNFKKIWVKRSYESSQTITPYNTKNNKTCTNIWDILYHLLKSNMWNQINGVYHLGLFQGLLSTENKRSSSWQLCHHWWHCKLSLWQLTVPPVTTKLSNWWSFVFSDPSTLSCSQSLQLVCTLELKSIGAPPSNELQWLDIEIGHQEKATTNGQHNDMPCLKGW